VGEGGINARKVRQRPNRVTKERGAALFVSPKREKLWGMGKKKNVQKIEGKRPVSSNKSLQILDGDGGKWRRVKPGEDDWLSTLGV